MNTNEGLNVHHYGEMASLSSSLLTSTIYIACVANTNSSSLSSRNCSQSDEPCDSLARAWLVLDEEIQNLKKQTNQTSGWISIVLKFYNASCLSDDDWNFKKLKTPVYDDWKYSLTFVGLDNYNVSFSMISLGDFRKDFMEAKYVNIQFNDVSLMLFQRFNSVSNCSFTSSKIEIPQPTGMVDVTFSNFTNCDFHSLTSIVFDPSSVSDDTLQIRNTTIVDSTFNFQVGRCVLFEAHIFQSLVTVQAQFTLRSSYLKDSSIRCAHSKECIFFDALWENSVLHSDFSSSVFISHLKARNAPYFVKMIAVTSVYMSGVDIQNMTSTDDEAIYLSVCTSATIADLSLRNTNHDGIVFSQVQVSTFSKMTLENIKGTAMRFLFGLKLFTASCSIHISSCSVRNTISNKGAAIYLEGSPSKPPNAHIQNCHFENNTVSESGGAIFGTNVILRMIHCAFINNHVTSPGFIGGGAISLLSYSNAVEKYPLQVSNVLFVNNSAKGWGGAMFIEGKLVGEMNATCVNNNAQVGGCVFVNSEQSILKINLKGTSTSYNYGNLIAAIPIMNNITLFVQDNLSSVYPGQTFDMKLAFWDYFGQQVDWFEEMPTLIASSQHVELFYSTSISNHLVHFNNVYFKSPMNHSESTFSVSLDVVVKRQGTTLKAPLLKSLALTSCYSSQTIEVSVDNLYFVCKPVNTLVLALAISMSILTFFLGLLFGALILYGIIVVIKKIRLLNKKQKAEREVSNNSHGSRGQSENVQQERSYLISAQEIVIVKRIGEGANGVVYLAKWNNTQVAIKSLKTDTCSTSSIERDNTNIVELEEFIDSSVHEFEKEAMIMSSLRHPNIVFFYGIIVSEERKFMVVEFMNGGSLESLIGKLKTGRRMLNLIQKVSILCDIANGMHYLHSLKPKLILHRDLKPGNILLDDRDRCKVCDFGLAKMMGQTFNSALTNNIGTLFYMAPECFVDDNLSPTWSDETDNLRLTKLDVYSFGIIMYELLFEETPYNMTSEKLDYFSENEPSSTMHNSLAFLPQFLYKQLRPKIPFKDANQEYEWCKQFVYKDPSMLSLKETVCVFNKLVELMKQAWDQNPHNRPSFQTISQMLQNILDEK
ncbi:hypothetical protein C9374_010697 [Naegleria lovaniensis]|uniref:Protein kinase domain-containing protein n=1 Tax=Naegleria lovaniensis TaxID=51637 RepID=A0AA88GGD9_NAELO|nr:uncharacterized protein C9374_010697 [Naegleria lovaniensis]KAG2374413.1 hypothetical protein C9374_010697 [Naegleria lovaniensis]